MNNPNVESPIRMSSVQYIFLFLEMGLFEVVMRSVLPAADNNHRAQLGESGGNFDKEFRYF